MKIKTTISVIGALTLLLATSLEAQKVKKPSLAPGGNSSAGGNDIAAEFKEIGRVFFGKVKEAGIEQVDPQLSLDELFAVIDETIIEESIHTIYVDGRVVNALNFPNQKLIKIHSGRWHNLSFFEKRRLVIHEFLNVSGKVVDSVNYAYTYKLMKKVGVIYGETKDTGYSEAHFSCRDNKDRMEAFVAKVELTKTTFKAIFSDNSHPSFFGHSNLVDDVARSVGIDFNSITVGDDADIHDAIAVMETSEGVGLNSKNCFAKPSIIDYFPVFNCSFEEVKLTLTNKRGEEQEHILENVKFTGNRLLEDDFSTLYSPPKNLYFFAIKKESEGSTFRHDFKDYAEVCRI